jgi:hypothetical protein
MDNELNLDNLTVDDVKVVTSEPVTSSEPVIADPTPDPTPSPVIADPAPSPAPTPSTDPSPSPAPQPAPQNIDINSLLQTIGVKSIDEVPTTIQQLREAAQVKELLKDDFITEAVKYYNETGDLTPYLQVKTVDYSKVSDEDILKMQLRKDNPTLSDKALNFLYEDAVVNRYKLNPDAFDPDQVEIGKELLGVEAAKIRQHLIDEQQKFKAPEKQPQVDNSAAEVQAWAKTVEEHPAIKTLINDKRVGVEFNGEKFSWEVQDPGFIKDATVDNAKFFQLFLNDDGSHNLEKWAKVVNYAADMDAYEKSLISHGKTLGESAIVERRKNPSDINTPAFTPGTTTEGDFSEQLLNAFAAGGIKRY